MRGLVPSGDNLGCPEQPDGDQNGRPLVCSAGVPRREDVAGTAVFPILGQQPVRESCLHRVNPILPLSVEVPH